MVEAWTAITEIGDAFGKPVYIENILMFQLNRISELRSRGESWTKALSQLRSLVSGLENEDFRRAWNSVVVDAVNLNGRIIEIPSEEQNHERLQVLMNLLSERGLTWKRKTISKTGPAAFKE